MIRAYPVRCQEYRDLHEQTVTVPLSGLSGGGRESRPLEKVALRSLPPQIQREYDAVRLAIEKTRLLTDPKERLELIRLTMWQYRYTIYNAADIVHLSPRTALRYRHQFVLLVALSYGLLSETEYLEAVKRGRTVENGPPKANEML